MKYGYIDAHCDTVVKAYDKGERLYENNLHIDLERLKKFDCPLQFFAIWLDKIHHDNAFIKTNEYIDFFDNEIRENSSVVSAVRCFGDIEKNKNEGKISALLAIEGGEAVEGSIEKLISLYNRGVRAMTLTWNYKNALADGAGVENAVGLYDFGREAVLKMNEIGMIVDVSHLADKSFWDVYETAKKPFMATHSNSRYVCGAKRNLTDEQIRAVAQCGGVIGFNMCSKFVADEGRGKTEDIFKHMDHIMNVGGEDILGFGCDFDGIESMPEGFTDVSSMESLFEKMEKRYGFAVTEKITEKNFMRFLKDVL